MSACSWRSLDEARATTASATVALAGIDVHLVVGVFAVAVDDVPTVECVVVFERFVRSKAVSIDGQRLLLAVVVTIKSTQGRED